MTSTQLILQKQGPLISSKLARELSIKEKIKENTASQRIARSSDILQVKGFFKSNQSLCYLPEHANDDTLLYCLSESMFENGRKYWFTLNALKMHEGIVSKRYLECYTNYPIQPLKGHLPFERIMQNFVGENIIVFNGMDYIYSPQFSKIITNPLLHRTIELIKDNILNDFHSLARNTGLISYETGETFAEFGKFRWAFKGVSPIAGLKNNGKFGYLLADILVGRPFYKNDVLFFIEKLKHIQSFKNASNIFPIMLIDDLAPEALHLLKTQGIVIGFIKELFGSKYAETLKELISILNNAGASLKTNPDKYLELILELKKYNEGLANNIRGALFEFVVGHIHQEDCQSINLGREIIENSGRHDMDVLAIYSNKIVVAECKATKSLVDIDMVDDWLSKKLTAFRSWILKQETHKTKAVEFEYWSTSGFTPEAIQTLDERVTSTKLYKISYYGPEDLREKAKQMKNKKLKEALDNFFLKPQV
jgi:hypothetical protein